MAHNCLRGGVCALPDGHNGRHRTPAGLAKYRESQAAWSVSEIGRDARDRWKARNPVQVALSAARDAAARRGR